MVMQIEHVELVIDIIRLMFENHWIMGMCMSMQCWEVLCIVEIVDLWVGFIKNQHPDLFRMLKYIYEFIEIGQIIIQGISCLDLS